LDRCHDLWGKALIVVLRFLSPSGWELDPVFAMRVMHREAFCYTVGRYLKSGNLLRYHAKAAMVRDGLLPCPSRKAEFGA